MKLWWNYWWNEMHKIIVQPIINLFSSRDEWEIDQTIAIERQLLRASERAQRCTPVEQIEAPANSATKWRAEGFRGLSEASGRTRENAARAARRRYRRRWRWHPQWRWTRRRHGTAREDLPCSRAIAQLRISATAAPRHPLGPRPSGTWRSRQHARVVCPALA